MEWRQSILGLGGDGRPALQHHLYDIVVAWAGGTVQRREPVPSAGFEIGAAVQQQSHKVDFAPFGGDVQRCYVVLKYKKKHIKSYQMY